MDGEVSFNATLTNWIKYIWMEKYTVNIMLDKIQENSHVYTDIQEMKTRREGEKKP